jgi:hypothetical protein
MKDSTQEVFIDDVKGFRGGVRGRDSNAKDINTLALALRVFKEREAPRGFRATVFCF